jgi:hypothetical protein
LKAILTCIVCLFALLLCFDFKLRTYAFLPWPYMNLAAPSVYTWVSLFSLQINIQVLSELENKIWLQQMKLQEYIIKFKPFTYELRTALLKVDDDKNVLPSRYLFSSLILSFILMSSSSALRSNGESEACIRPA